MTSEANYGPTPARELAPPILAEQVFSASQDWAQHPDTIVPGSTPTFLVSEYRGEPVEITIMIEDFDPEEEWGSSYQIGELRMVPRGYVEPTVMMDPGSGAAFVVSGSAEDLAPNPLKKRFEFYRDGRGVVTMDDDDFLYTDSSPDFGTYDDDARALLATLKTAQPNHEAIALSRKIYQQTEERLAQLRQIRETQENKANNPPFWRRGVFKKLFSRLFPDN